MSITTNIQRFLMVPVVLALAVLLSQCSMLNRNAFADSYGDFDETGTYRYHKKTCSSLRS